LRDKKDKQKARTSKCATAISLLLGVAESTATSKRDGEHPYDWTTDYFDEEFVDSDDRLEDWPNDIDVEQISADVDHDAFLKAWSEMIDDRKRKPNPCTGVGKRSLESRGSQRRSSEEWYGDDELDTRSYNSSTLVEVYTGPVHPSEMSARGTGELEERNPLLLIFQILAQFETRLGVSLASRASASVAAHAPRLAQLMKTPERLFQIAKTGQGTRAGAQGMKNARQTIKSDFRWKKCIKNGLPL
jgi:hypothetical protein